MSGNPQPPPGAASSHVEITGQFWTPDTPPERAVGGALRFNRGSGLRLSLLDSLDRSDPYSGPEEHDVILGATHQGRPVTLVDCWSTNRSVSGPWVVPRETYYVRTAYIGAHLGEALARRFATATLTIDTLDAWALTSGIQTDFPPGGTDESTIVWRNPGDVSAGFDGGRVTLDTAVHRHVTLRGASMTERARLTVELDDPLAWTELLARFVAPLQNLTTLMVGEPAVLERLVVQSPAVPEPKRPDFLTPIEVLYEPLGDAAPRTEWITPILKLSEANVPFQDLARTWLRISSDDDLGPVMSVFFGTQYKAPGFVELRFLMLAVALEAYHRIRYPDRSREDPERFRTRVDIIRDAARKDDRLRSEDRGWLKQALRHANDPWLSQRFEDVLMTCRPYLPNPLDETRIVAQRLAKTRNQIAHGLLAEDESADDPSDKPKLEPLLNNERFFAEQLLRILLATLLFHELRIPPVTLQQAWRKNGSFGWAWPRIEAVHWIPDA